MISKIMTFFIWFFVWILLSWPPDVNDIVTGIITAAFVTFMTFDIGGKVTGPMNRSLVGNLKKIPYFILYIFVFLWECMKANIDVAYRVIHPRLPIRPGTVRVRTSLKSDAGLTFLANSITLTPGTTAVDVDRQNGFIYVHWLYVKEDYDRSAMRLDVVTKFENILKNIFE